MTCSIFKYSTFIYRRKQIVITSTFLSLFIGEELKENNQECADKCSVFTSNVAISPSPRKKSETIPFPDQGNICVTTIEVVEETPPSPKRPCLLRVPSFNNTSHRDQEVNTF